MALAKYEYDSDRLCRSCGHALPHNSSEDEDSYLRCSYKVTKKVAGYNCGHKRYRKSCEDGSVTDGACYSFTAYPCGCSEEDRTIADLRARVAELEALTA